LYSSNLRLDSNTVKIIAGNSGVDTGTGNLRTVLGKYNGTDYGLRIWDGTNTFVELSSNGTNKISNWYITPTVLYNTGSLGGIILDAGNKIINVMTGSYGDEKIVQVGQLTTNNYGIRGYDTEGTELFRLGMLGNVIAGWEISGSRIVDATQKVQMDAGNSRFLIQDAAGNERVRMGLLNATQYGISGSDSSGDLVFKLGEAGNEIAGWTIEPSLITDTTGTYNVVIASGANPKIYFGTGTYDNTNTPFYVDSTGIMSLGDSLTFDGTDLTLSGTIYASAGSFTGNVSAGSGNIGNWNIVSGEIASGTDIVLDATNKRISLNNSAIVFGYDAGGSGLHGVYLDANNYWYSSGAFKVYADANNYIDFDGSTVDINSTNFELSATNISLSSADKRITAGTSNTIVIMDGDEGI